MYKHPDSVIKIITEASSLFHLREKLPILELYVNEVFFDLKASKGPLIERLDTPTLGAQIAWEIGMVTDEEAAGLLEDLLHRLEDNCKGYYGPFKALIDNRVSEAAPYLFCVSVIPHPSQIIY